MKSRCAIALLYPMMASFLFCGPGSFAQPNPDSLSQVGDSYPVSFYRKKLNTAAKFFNSREYKAYQAVKDETPYLFQEWVEANLMYDDQPYDHVPIMIDLSNGAVVINYMNGLRQLVSEKLSQFVIKGRRFIFLHPVGLTAGFYESLYDGKIKAYSHREKKRKERIDGMDIVREFEEHVQYYVMIENELHPVNGKKDFLELFPDKMQPLKTYISREKLRFKKFEHDLIALATFCDRLE